jgi:hydrogenase maturation protease
MTFGLHHAPSRVSVIGIGNILLGDDGFGPVAVEIFRCLYQCSPTVKLLDLGTPGLDIAPYLYDVELVILVDSVRAHGKPGTLSIYSESDILSGQAQLRLSSHDPGVLESLVQLRLAGHAPTEVILVGAVPESCDVGLRISPAALSAASLAAATIADVLLQRSVPCSRRPTADEGNFWWLSSIQQQSIAVDVLVQKETVLTGLSG